MSSDLVILQYLGLRTAVLSPSCVFCIPHEALLEHETQPGFLAKGDSTMMLHKDAGSHGVSEGMPKSDP